MVEEGNQIVSVPVILQVTELPAKLIDAAATPPPRRCTPLLRPHDFAPMSPSRCLHVCLEKRFGGMKK